MAVAVMLVAVMVMLFLSVAGTPLNGTRPKLTPGLSKVTPTLSGAFRYRRPEPRSIGFSPRAAGSWAVLIKALLISAGVQSGWSWRMSAAEAVTWGAAIEVPWYSAKLAVESPKALAETEERILTPGAVISGVKPRSGVGPRLLKMARKSAQPLLAIRKDPASKSPVTVA